MRGVNLAAAVIGLDLAVINWKNAVSKTNLRMLIRHTEQEPVAGFSSPPAIGRPTLDEKILRRWQFGERLTFFLPRRSHSP
jgi:hypothetical protein